MKIGIIGAMHEEVSSIKKNMTSLSSKKIAKREYSSGKLHGIDTVLVFSRWGKVAAASTVTTLINEFKIDFLLFTGVAGAIHPELNIGDVIVADTLIQHDMDASPLFPKFHIPLTDFSYFPVNKEIVTQIKSSVDKFLIDICDEIGKSSLNEFNINTPKCLIGTIASGDQFIADVERAKILGNEIKNLMCVEMEGAAVAQVCHEHEIPYSVIRVISDKADHTASIDFPKFIEKIACEYSSTIVKNMYEDFNFSKLV
jgi:adenosylhomocysteine nucleosidase